MHLKNMLDQQKLKHEQDIKRVQMKLEKDILVSVDLSIKKLS